MRGGLFTIPPVFEIPTLHEKIIHADPTNAFFKSYLLSPIGFACFPDANSGFKTLRTRRNIKNRLIPSGRPGGLSGLFEVTLLPVEKLENKSTGVIPVSSQGEVGIRCRR